jgi:ribosome-binding factor A
MNKNYKRSDRVADLLQKEICEMLFKEVKDPHIGFITITGVEVSRDLKIAKIFYTTLGNPDQIAESSRALQRITPFIKKHLGKRIRLRSIPDILFRYDNSLEYGAKIDHILDRLKEPPTPAVFEE